MSPFRVIGAVVGLIVPSELIVIKLLELTGGMLNTNDNVRRLAKSGVKTF